ncbi:MAG: hypothetical protein V3V00_15580 [Saprospiraceae bacterium]
MRPTKFFFKFLFFTLGVVIFSCTSDGPVVGGGNEFDSPPALTIKVEGGFGSEKIELNPSQTFIITLSGIAGSSLMDVLKITENGKLVEASRILQDGKLIVANPKLILGSEKDEFSYRFEISTSDQEIMSTYAFNIVDENELGETVEVQVSTLIADPLLNNLGINTFEVSPNTLVEIKLEAILGSADFGFIIIADSEGTIEEHTRFYYGNTDTQFDDNPFAVPTEDKKGFSKSIYIRVHEQGAKGYRIFIIDENERGAFIDITIVVGKPTNNIFGVLFNAAGPEGRGGLDLDEGLGTGSMSSLAEIKDEGIDLNQPITDNWKRQISGANGSIVRSLEIGMNGLSENYDFINDFLRADLVGLFEVGIDFTVTNANNEVVSPLVNVGDSFAVRNGENYYLIFIREVNVIGDDNMDNYVIDIKQ